jgi:hypothetical protein
VSDRLWAASQLSDHPDVCQALVEGVGVPRDRLRADVLKRIGEATIGEPFVLTHRDVLRVEMSLNGVVAGESSEPTAEVTGLQAITARALGALPEPPETDMLVGPLVVRGARTIVVGDTGHGKTTFSFQLAGAVLNGSDMLGYHGCGTGPVLIIDLEQGLRSIKRVLRETRLADRDDVLFVRTPDGLSLDSDQQQRAELAGVIARHRPALVIVDPYYKAHRGDVNEERPIVDLMRYLDALRTEHNFALILPAHPRKDPLSKTARKLTLHDVAGSGAVVRGAEIVLALERLSPGYARLRFLKDRDGDLPVGEAWGLLFDRDEGFRRDPADGAPARDLEGEIASYVGEHPRSSTNDIAQGVAAGRARVSEILKSSDLFTFEAGPNRSRLWVARTAETHTGHLFAPSEGSGGLTGGPSIEGHHRATDAAGGLGGLGHPAEDAP